MPEEELFADESIVNTEPESPGAKLSAARFEYDLSRADVAAYLNLSERVITALENDDYDQLPGPTFAKGYMRAYARLMNLDEEEIVRGIEVVPQDRLEVPNTAGGGISRRMVGQRQKRRGWIWILLLATAVAAAWLLLDGGSLRLPDAVKGMNLPFFGEKPEQASEITFPPAQPVPADMPAEEGNALLEKGRD